MGMQTLELWDLVRRGPQVDPSDLAHAVCEQAAAGDFLAAPDLKKIATDNWKILFGEDLPS